MDLIQCQFIFRNVENAAFKAMLYITPEIVPNTGSANIIVGDSIRNSIGGSNVDPVINLYAAPYSIRLVGAKYETIFKIDLTNAPTGSVVNAVNYITS